MTKMDHRKAADLDPARVIKVRESGIWVGNDQHPFETEIQRDKRYSTAAKARATANKKLIARSQAKRLKQIAKKKARVWRQASTPDDSLSESRSSLD